MQVTFAEDKSFEKMRLHAVYLRSFTTWVIEFMRYLVQHLVGCWFTSLLNSLLLCLHADFVTCLLVTSYLFLVCLLTCVLA